MAPACRAVLLLSAAVCAAVALDPRARALALLGQMNLTDKVSLLHGSNSPSYTGLMAGVPHLGIPALTLNDGRQGFRPNDGSSGQTAFPCQLAVVSTFDVDLMRAFGAALGEEFADKGANVVLAPMLILARVPQGGRNFESIGEDPELAYNLAFAHVSGVQSVPGVLCNADDFVLNNQEDDRGDISAVCDERTLFELYYRGYKGSIDAGVDSIMCSYNRINGTHACENNVTLGHLKSPTGLNFSGHVLSDWGGVHSTVASALAGLDMEMPGSLFFGDLLVEAVVTGAVPESVIDDKVLRILTPMFAQGVFDIPRSGTPDTNTTSPRHAALARTIAAAGMVLLKNENGVLPLSDSVRNIVVVGLAADVTPYCCGAGSGGLIPPYVITPLAGVRERAGAGVNVTYVPANDNFQNISTWFAASRGDHFLDFSCDECYDLYIDVRSEGFASPGPCSADLECSELQLWWNGVSQSNLVFVEGLGFSPPPGYAYVRPLAYILPVNYSGELETTVLELWSGLDTPTGQPSFSHTDFWTLSSNASRTDAIAGNYTKVLELGRVLTRPFVPRAPAVDGVVLIVVSTPSSEGGDRTNLNLSAADDALIAAWAMSNPTNTLVIINNPGAVVMGWAEGVSAIIAAWYPGQEMGHALADVLWGDVNPSGRLPLTFPKTNNDSPLRTPAQYPGVNGTVTYTEQLLIGYRWFDAAAVAPLFPFGHGLSYTSFAYSNLTVDAAVDAPNVRVTFVVTNAGSRAGKEVPQTYVTFPATAGEPLNQLRGFSVVLLDAGEAISVSVTLTPRDLSVWDVDAHAWARVPGTFGVHVGASSRDFRLSGSFQGGE